MADEDLTDDDIHDLLLMYASKEGCSKLLDFLERNAKTLNLGMYEQRSDLFLVAGEICFELSKYDDSLLYLDKEIEMCGKEGDIYGQALGYYVKAGVYATIASFEKAIKFLKKAIDLYNQLYVNLNEDVCEELADAYDYLGTIYMIVGDYNKAIENCEKSLQMFKKIGYNPGIFVSYTTIGDSYKLMGNYKNAVEAYENALSFYERLEKKELFENHHYSFMYLSSRYLYLAFNIIQIYDYFLNDKNKTESLRHKFIGDYLNLACIAWCDIIDIESLKEEVTEEDMGSIERQELLQFIEFVMYMRNTTKKAIDAFENNKHDEEIINFLKLSIGNKIANLTNITLTSVYKKSPYYINIGRDYMNMGHGAWLVGDYAQAYKFYRQALDILESVRENLRVKEHDLSYFQSIRETYLSAIILGVMLGKNEEVLELIERNKSRVFIRELLGKRKPKIKVDNAELRDLVNKKEDILKKIKFLDILTGMMPPEVRSDVKSSKEKAINLRSLLDEYNQIVGKIHEVDPNYYLSTEVPDVKADEIQKRIPKNISALELFIAGGKLIVVYVSSNEIIVRDTEYKKKKVWEYISNITKISHKKPAVDIPPLNATEIIPDDLLEKIIKSDVLWISPHQELHFFPFAVLKCPDGKYLVEHVPVVYWPTLSLLEVISPLDIESVLHGDKFVFGDPQNNLKYARLEAEKVSRVLQGKLYLGKETTIENVKNALASGDMLHFAGHVKYRRYSPMLSSLQLYNGSLTAEEIMDIPSKAKFVVLSGCESGLGEIRGGDEIMGLSRGLMYSGVQTLVATLWPVEDQSTQAFMETFYDILNRKKIGIAKALQETQKKFIHSEEWKHPFYWSGFVVIGAKK